MGNRRRGSRIDAAVCVAIFSPLLKRLLLPSHFLATEAVASGGDEEVMPFGLQTVDTQQLYSFTAYSFSPLYLISYRTHLSRDR